MQPLGLIMTGVDVPRLQVRLSELEDQLKNVVSRCDLLEDCNARLVDVVTLLTDLIEHKGLRHES